MCCFKIWKGLRGEHKKSVPSCSGLLHNRALFSQLTFCRWGWHFGYLGQCWASSDPHLWPTVYICRITPSHLTDTVEKHLSRLPPLELFSHSIGLVLGSYPIPNCRLKHCSLVVNSDSNRSSRNRLLVFPSYLQNHLASKNQAFVPWAKTKLRTKKPRTVS